MDAAPALPNFDPLDPVQLAEALAEENKDLIERAAALLEKAKEWEAAPAIADAEEAQDLADFMRQVANLVGDKGSANVRRVARKGPFDVLANTVQTFFKDKLLDPFAPFRPKLVAKANAWLALENARLEKERLRLAAEAAAKLAAATTADQVKTAAKEIKAAAAPVKAGVKSDFGSSLHQTSRWDFEIVDIAKVPAKFLTVDRVAVMAFIKTGTPKEPVKIEGITVKRVTTAVGT